jgi:hypothetical protein
MYIYHFYVACRGEPTNVDMCQFLSGLFFIRPIIILLLISNVYTLGQIRHIIYVQCPHTGIFVFFMGIYDNGTGIASGNHRIVQSVYKGQ